MKDDSHARFAGSASGFHKVAVTQRQRLSAQHASSWSPRGNGNDDSHRDHAARGQVSGQHDQEAQAEGDEEYRRADVQDAETQPPEITPKKANYHHDQLR